MKYLLTLLSAVLACANCRSAPSVILVDNGVARCHIIVEKDAPPSADFGAREIAKYFGKASGAEVKVGEEVKVEGQERSIPIFIGVDAKLPEEGFEINVTAEKVTVTGADARGVLYGCYEVLKRWAGMRWLVPGDDGEYCVLGGRTIAAPVGRIAMKPATAVRKYGVATDEDLLWSARNNMQSALSWKHFGGPGGADTRRLEERAVYGTGMSGHCLTRLMCNYGDDPKKLFAEHPEYFCLVKGERKMSGLAGYGPNPCTSNPEVLDRIANTIVRIASQPHGNEDSVTIGNDDSMQWCECENCTRLDVPEAKKTRGARSDRYWWTVNEIARRVWAQKPDAKLGAWAYQDFWFPPVRVKPDPRLVLTISYNNQCWRHSMGDPDCPENVEMAKIFAMWRPFGFKTIVNRNEFTCEGCPGGTFAPVSRVVTESLRQAAVTGCNGHTWAARGPFPDPLPWEAKHPERYPPYGGKNLKWYACWQAMYAIARQGWDPSRDLSAEEEEANRLYYGKAWEGGLKEFRATLEKAYFGTPFCITWPDQHKIGRVLDSPGAEAALADSLARALAAADDPRALKHVKDVEEIFACTWTREHEAWLKSYREADFLANQDPLAGQAVRLGRKTYVQGAYDRKGVDLVVTAFEPRPGERIAVRVVRPDLTNGVYRSIRAVATPASAAPALLRFRASAEALGAPVLDGTILRLEVVRADGKADGRLKTFVRCRPTPAVNCSFRRTFPVWQNWSLDALGPKGTPIGWTLPKEGFEVLLHEGSATNRYVRLGEGAPEIGQGYYLPATARRSHRVVARVRGKGTVRFWTSSYRHVGGVNGYNAIVEGSAKSKVFTLTDDWRTLSLETESVGAEEEMISVRFFRGKGATLDLDDAYVVPLEGQGGER